MSAFWLFSSQNCFPEDFEKVICINDYEERVADQCNKYCGYPEVFFRCDQIFRELFIQISCLKNQHFYKKNEKNEFKFSKKAYK